MKRLKYTPEDENESKDRQPSGETEPGTEKECLLSSLEIAKLHSFTDENSGYFYDMLLYLNDVVSRGIAEGRFTEEEACEDLEIALWYGYACNNLDTYRYYVESVDRMAGAEKNAAGCAAWFYRYSVALMYCGKLEEALHYAERGAAEEPDYPWIWLQTAKMRSHFGDGEGAQKAVEQGLSLVPGDYEFLTLQAEIDEGLSLEEMEYHWINPEFDRNLQDGLDADGESKLQAISCILLDKEALKQTEELFGVPQSQWLQQEPFCVFDYSSDCGDVELFFGMNRAGLSKMELTWLREQKEKLDKDTWGAFCTEDGQEGTLDTVFFELDYSITLLYRVLETGGYFHMRLNKDGVREGEIVFSSEEEEETFFAAEMYDEEELEFIEEHITENFGPFETVFHELVSPDIHVDICIIPPCGERRFYTLVTMGMGAHCMNVPESLEEYHLERAELAISVPDYWNLNSEDERWYWPIRLLKVLARLPIESDSWLGWGHTVDHRNAFADDTDLCGAFITEPVSARNHEEAPVCMLPNGEEVNFYQVLTLTRDELDYKMEYGAEALMDYLEGSSFVVDPERTGNLLEKSDRKDQADFGLMS